MDPKIKSYIEKVINDAVRQDERKMTVDYEYAVHNGVLILAMRCNFLTVARKIIYRLEHNLTRNCKGITSVSIIHLNNWRYNVDGRYSVIERSNGIDPNHTIGRVTLMNHMYTLTDYTKDYSGIPFNALPHLNKLKLHGYDYTDDYTEDGRTEDQWERFVKAMKECYDEDVVTITETEKGKVIWNGKSAK